MMANGTVFSRTGLDRRVTKWESELSTVTPVEQGPETGTWYKRDDYFAPVGAGGINGSTLRQLIWLMTRRPMAGVISAASVKSSQHAMVASVAKHLGVPSLQVMGATTYAKAIKYPSVAIADMMGAEFDFLTVANKNALQSRLRLLRRRYPDHVVIEHAVGLETNVSVSLIRSFHGVVKSQASNIPDARNIFIPADSCNTAMSILAGLSDVKHRADVHLVGMGPNRLSWLTQRWRAWGGYVSGWVPAERQHEYRATLHAGDWSASVTYYDLPAKNVFVNRLIDHTDGIALHPEYEAKMIRWMRARDQSWLSDASLVWIVGGETRVDVMRSALRNSVAAA